MDAMRAVLVGFVVVLASLHSASAFPSQDEQDEFQAESEWRHQYRSNMSPCEFIHNVLDSEDHNLTDSQVQMMNTLLERICNNATEEVRWFGFHRPQNPLTILCGRLNNFITNAAGLKVPIDSNLSSANSSQLLVTALSEICATSRAIFGRQEESDKPLEFTTFPAPPNGSPPPPPPPPHPEGSGPPPPPPPPPPPEGSGPPPPDMSPPPPPPRARKPWIVEPRK